MIYIEIDVDKGERIHDVCKAAVRVSVGLNISVKFTFNGIEVYVEPGDSADSVHDRWSEVNRRMAEEARKKAKELRMQTIDELVEIAKEEYRDRFKTDENPWRGAIKAVAERLGHHIEEES